MDLSPSGGSGQSGQDGRSAAESLPLMPSSLTDFVDIPLGSPSLSLVMANTEEKEFSPPPSFSDPVVLAPHSSIVCGIKVLPPHSVSTLKVLAPPPFSVPTVKNLVPPLSTASAAVTLAPPPSSASAAVTLAPPPSSVSAAVTMAPPPSSVSAAMTLAPPTSSVSAAVTLAPPPSSVSAAVTLAPPPSSVSAAVTLAPPPSSVSAAVTLVPPPSSVSAAVTLAPPPSSVSAAVTMAPPPSSVSAAVTLALPPSSVSAAVTLAPPPSSVSAAVTLAPPPPSNAEGTLALPSSASAAGTLVPTPYSASAVATTASPPSTGSTAGSLAPPHSTGSTAVSMAPPPSSASAVGTLSLPPSSAGTLNMPTSSESTATSLAPMLSSAPGVAPAQSVGTAIAFAPPVMCAGSVLTYPTSMVNVPSTNAQLLNPMIGLNPTLAPSCLPSLGTYSTAPNLALPGYAAVPQSAPAPQTTCAFPGYEGIPTGIGDGKVMPPPPHLTLVPELVALPDVAKWTFPPITENEATNAFLRYARRKCCYGSAPAREMAVKEFSSLGLYRYRLETFTESRACKWVTAQYVGQDVDSPAEGSIPQPWNIPAQVKVLFKDGIRRVTIPQSRILMVCSKCKGMGTVFCPKCHGNGRTPCLVCNGTGRRMQMEMCPNCYGNGMECCRICQNNQRPCAGCRGNGQIIEYIQMTITWKNHVFEFIEEHNTDFPSELFKKANGEIIFTDEQEMVPPLLNAPMSSISNASQDAQAQHQRLFSSCRVLKQRQCVEWLPLTKIDYSWKGNDFTYYVYGKDNMVHSVTYPAKCCCILT
uniref:Protein SSUH2 homolog n=1 Tax=Leptobrachium leishanense TaxID=445787 RepID=A0A8C5PYC8_9ANUR